MSEHTIESEETVEVDLALFAFLVKRAEQEQRSCVNSEYPDTRPDFMETFDEALDKADEILVEAYNDE